MVQGVGVVSAYGVCAHVLGGLAAAAALSALLVGVRVCIARTHRQRVLLRLHRGGQRAWLLQEPSGSAQGDVSSAPRQEGASAERSQRRDELL